MSRSLWSKPVIRVCGLNYMGVTSKAGTSITFMNSAFFYIRFGSMVPCKQSSLLGDRRDIWDTSHLHGKTGNSSWKIKWFTPFHLGSCLRSKRSRTSRTKYQAARSREKEFHIRDARKMGREQKGRGRGVREGKEGNACPQTPLFWKTRSPTNGASDWCGVVYLIDRLDIEVSYWKTKLAARNVWQILNCVFEWSFIGAQRNRDGFFRWKKNKRVQCLIFLTAEM